MKYDCLSCFSHAWTSAWTIPLLGTIQLYLKQIFSHPAMPYMLPFTFVMWRLVFFWRSPQENNHSLQCFILLLFFSCFTCTQYSEFVSERCTEEGICYYPLGACWLLQWLIPFFCHYCACVPSSSSQHMVRSFDGLYLLGNIIALSYQFH